MTAPRLVVCAPSRIEASRLAPRKQPATESGAGVAVRRVGVGPRAAARAGRRLAARSARDILVAGVAGGLQTELRTGHVVVATEVRGPDGAARACPGAPLLAALLRARGLTVHLGPILSSPRVVAGARRRDLAATGALCVDMESSWLLAAAAPATAAVVRVIADPADAPLLRPASVARFRAALRTLAACRPAFDSWAAALDDRSVLLASPRSFCAGVVRAIDVVDHALTQRGSPVYVRKQIVHNVHVVADLQQRGAVFVDELDEVPDDALVVFSAHGVSPAVRENASRRKLDVIDATCPLVSKVHSEIRRFADRGDTVIFIGHAGHEETVGTMGERPADTVLVENVADARTVQVPDPDRVSYLVQTTLSVDEVADIVTILRERFPKLRAPATDDICYATTNRQRSLQAVASESDVVLVVGSSNSSNSNRLVENSRRMGVPAYLIDDASDIDPNWLVGAGKVGVTAGASAPMSLVDEVITVIGGLGAVEVRERNVTTEDIQFSLPKEVRQP